MKIVNGKRHCARLECLTFANEFYSIRFLSSLFTKPNQTPAYKRRLNEQNKIVKDENRMQIATEQFEEPLYFNITEEHPISWKVYVEICKCWLFFVMFCVNPMNTKGHPHITFNFAFSNIN